MKKQSHTPGPWKAKQTDKAKWSVRAIGGPIKQTHDGATGVCMINGRNVPSWTQKANARLIALAPEMLEALKSAAFDISEMGCTCVDRSKGHQVDCVGMDNANDIYALIARAEGKS